MPSSPCSITGIRTKPPLEQWWSLAKRYAFRTWPNLLNGTGVFLITKTIKCQRYAHCFSDGTPGERAQIRVHGVMQLPMNGGQFSLPAQGTQWVPMHNEMEFQMADSGGKGAYTIFMEREVSRMFHLTDISFKESAMKVWKYHPWRCY